MKLFSRTRTGTSTTDPVAALFELHPPESPRRGIMLQYLRPGGFGLRDLETGESLSWDHATLASEYGALVAEVVDIADRRDPERVEASTPGSALALVPDRRRVAVWDETMTYDIGYLEEDLARPVAAALERGAPLTVMSLWEVSAMDGRRTELRILIIPEDVALTVSLEQPTPARRTFSRVELG
jgi:hypothetical protein